MKNFEGNLENSSDGRNFENSRNMEAKRPMNGIEQPFSKNYMQDVIGIDAINLFDSERPSEYLPGEPILLERLSEKQHDKFEENADNEEANNKNDAQDSKDAEKKKDGLTDKERKELKERTGWPDEIIDCISSMEEAEIYEKAGLQAVEIDGKWCLIRSDIDPEQLDEDGISNREKMERGRPPLTKDGKEVELHHIGQKQDSPLAELTMEEHRGAGNDTILHDKMKESEIDRTFFAKERKEHWKSRENG